MSHRVTHLIPGTNYILKFLTYVMPVIRYAAWSKTSHSSYKVWSEAAGITPVMIRKLAKIRNRYNQVPHLTKDTTWVSDKIKHHK